MANLLNWFKNEVGQVGHAIGGVEHNIQQRFSPPNLQQQHNTVNNINRAIGGSPVQQAQRAPIIPPHYVNPIQAVGNIRLPSVPGITEGANQHNPGMPLNQLPGKALHFLGNATGVNTIAQHAIADAQAHRNPLTGFAGTVGDIGKGLINSAAYPGASVAATLTNKAQPVIGGPPVKPYGKQIKEQGVLPVALNTAMGVATLAGGIKGGKNLADKASRPSIEQQIHEATVKEGGATLNLKGQAPPKNSIIYSPSKSTETVIPADKYSLADQSAFRQKYATELAKPGNYIGTYHDENGNVVLDVSTAGSHSAATIEAAHAAHQDAVWDNTHNKLIPTGKTDVNGAYLPHDTPSNIFAQHHGQDTGAAPPRNSGSSEQVPKNIQPKSGQGGGKAPTPPKLSQATSGPLTPSEVRGGITTTKNSPNVSPEVKAQLTGTPLVRRPQAPQIAKSEAAVSSDLTGATEKTMRALNQTPGRLTDQQFIDAAKVAEAHDTAGNHQLASDIYSKMATHSTRTAQSLAARGVLSQMSPAGMRYKAQSVLENAGVKFEGNIAKKVQALVDAVKSTKQGTPERDLAVQKLSNTVNNAIPRGKADAAIELWRTGLLTGPETIAKVGTSLALNTPGELTMRPIAAGIDRAVSKTPGVGWLNRNNPGYTPGERRVTFSPKDYGSFASGTVKGVKAAGTKLKTGLDIPGTGGFEKGIGGAHHQTPYEHAVYRAHGATFKPVYTGAYKMEMANQARLGVTGPKAEAAARTYAENFANQQKTELGKAANALQGVKIGPLPVGKWLVPFSRIPSAIGTKGIVDYTPVGTLRAATTLVKGIAKGTFDQRKFSESLAKSGVGGTVIVTTGALLMQHNRMALQQPTDAKEKALWLAEGKTPNSIKIGNTWVTLNTFGPLGIALGMGGAFDRAMNQKGDPLGAISEALGSGGKLLADQPYLQGITGAGNALKDPVRYAQGYLRSAATSLIPAASTQIAKGSDTTGRAPTTNILDAAKSKIPGLRETLPPQKDLFGGTLPGANPSGTIPGGILGTINPFYPQASRNVGDTATQELQRLYDALGGSSSHIAPPAKINGQKSTPTALNALESSAGPVIRTGVNNLLNNSQYQGLTDQQKADAINKVITAAQIAYGGGKQTAASQQAKNDAGNVGKNFTTSTKNGKTTSSLTFKAKKLKVPKLTKAKAPAKARAAKTKVAKVSKAPRFAAPKVAKIHQPKSVKIKKLAYKPYKPKKIAVSKMPKIV